MGNGLIPTIGIEVHAQLKTLSKMYCGCSTLFGDAANTHLCPVCLGLPGSLPKVNEQAIILGLKASRALGCPTPPFARFSRKNYFYPDLPKGYQITMHEHPLGQEGKLELLNANDENIEGIEIRRVHLEEDSAKLVHDSNKGTMIDFNRSGIPLVEIVTEPVISSGEQAVVYLKELRRLLRFLGISKANMDEGSFRCEINVSLNHPDDENLGPKVEIKNLNSFKSVKQCIDFEITRQQEILKRGGELVEETRGWDESGSVTVHQRFKENSADYRFFPEPDLPDLEIKGKILDDSTFDRENIPVRKVRSLIGRFGVGASVADLLMSGTGSPPDNPYFVAEFFETAIDKHGAKGTQAANFMIGPVFEYINKTGLTLDQTDLTPKKIAQVTDMVWRDDISSTQARKIISLILEEGGKVRDIVLREGLVQDTGEDDLIKLLREVMDSNEHIVDTIKRGKINAIGALVGEVMKKSKGQADPKRVNELFQELILKKKN